MRDNIDVIWIRFQMKPNVEILFVKVFVLTLHTVDADKDTRSMQLIIASVSNIYAISNPLKFASIHIFNLVRFPNKTGKLWINKHLTVSSAPSMF